MRRPIIAGNWKMYKTIAQTRAFFSAFNPLVNGATQSDVVICPTFVSLQAAIEATRDTHVQIGAQNLFWANEGAYTGEVSGEMLKAAGCQWVLIAHSERRQYFGETDATAHKRILAALKADLRPIVCVGEVLEDRESGRTNSVIEKQFAGGIAPLSGEQFARIAIAYEPVWAIGTGKTATPEIAADAHKVIRTLVGHQFGDLASGACRILYGGSVKPDNIVTLMAQHDIDGALVGGASLDPVSFASLVNYKASNSK